MTGLTFAVSAGLFTVSVALGVSADQQDSWATATLLGTASLLVGLLAVLAACFLDPFLDFYVW